MHVCARVCEWYFFLSWHWCVGTGRRAALEAHKATLRKEREKEQLELRRAKQLAVRIKQRERQERLISARKKYKSRVPPKRRVLATKKLDVNVNLECIWRRAEKGAEKAGQEWSGEGGLTEEESELGNLASFVERLMYGTRKLAFSSPTQEAHVHTHPPTQHSMSSKRAAYDQAFANRVTACSAYMLYQEVWWKENSHCAYPTLDLRHLAAALEKVQQIVAGSGTEDASAHVTAHAWGGASDGYGYERSSSSSSGFRDDGATKSARRGHEHCSQVNTIRRSPVHSHRRVKH